MSTPAKPRILLVNPAITDVAAYDLWARPLGLFLWAARLRKMGCQVAMIDATDRKHPRLPDNNLKQRKDGRGHYYQELLPERPEPARIALRRFKRYGLPPGGLRLAVADAVEQMGGTPDLVLMTTRMTYWYHGAVEAMGVLREALPDGVPIAVGGIYASLMPDHARDVLQPDHLITGPALAELPRSLHEKFNTGGGRELSSDIAKWPIPAYDLMYDHTALPVLTSIGCPGRCSYCAARTLWDKGFHRIAPSEAVQRLAKLHREYGTRHFAFYDDALLANPEHWFDPFLDELIEADLDLRFHLPNGIHYDPITLERAERMYAAGFHTIRLSLESIKPERLKTWRRSGSAHSFAHAVAALRKAGYEQNQIGAYILAGTPGQTHNEVKEAITFTFNTGAHVRLCEYSPIPATADWPAALKASGGEIEREPLWQNNSLYYHRPEAPIGPDEMEALKTIVRNGRDT